MQVSRRELLLYNFRESVVGEFIGSTLDSKKVCAPITTLNSQENVVTNEPRDCVSFVVGQGPVSQC